MSAHRLLLYKARTHHYKHAKDRCPVAWWITLLLHNVSTPFDSYRGLPEHSFRNKPLKTYFAFRNLHTSITVDAQTTRMYHFHPENRHALWDSESPFCASAILHSYKKTTIIIQRKITNRIHWRSCKTVFSVLSIVQNRNSHPNKAFKLHWCPWLQIWPRTWPKNRTEHWSQNFSESEVWGKAFLFVYIFTHCLNTLFSSTG